MSQRTIEVRVGILILLSLALLAGFVVVMGGLSLEPSFRVNVDFDNPGGLKSGAPVKMAGIKIGRITSIEFRATEAAPPGQPAPPMIRVVASVEKQYQNALHENSKWFVTTQGVLGELFLAVEPGSTDQPLLQDGAVVQGISPPRLDLLLSESYELLHKAYLGITHNEQKLAETFDGLHRTLKGTGDFFEKNGDRLTTIVENLEQVSVTANETLLAARERYVDGAQVRHILNNIETTSTVLNEQLPPTFEQTRGVLGDVSRLTTSLGSEEQAARYVQITKDVATLADQAKSMANDAQGLVEHVKAGKGPVGALVMDEAVYDDIQEMLRDLKHNPWKFFWRE
jgi:phospholipid/cholesterol/gamma-HCH transport system substrate-binding protein